MNRIVVVGTPGAGKSTLAEQLARALDYPFVEPDALFWGPNWTPAPPDVFRARVAAAITGERWTIGGNYSAARDLIWQRADTLIWLDYPLGLVLWRLLRRSLKRIVTQEELWNGNRETWRGQFWSRDSLLLFAIKTHRQRRRTFPAALQEPAYQHLHALHFRRPRETERWLGKLRLL